MVKFSDLIDALYFVSSSSPGMNSAYLSLESGEIIYRSDMGDIDEAADKDLEGDEWLSIPHKNDLDLGSQLVFQFVEEHLPDKYDQVRGFFRKAGAYGQYKALLETEGLLESWYEFEGQREKQALMEWCEENEVKVSA